MRSSKDSFRVRFGNNKVVKFHTHQAYSDCMEKLSKGRYKNSGEMYQAARECFTGFESKAISDKKSQELEKKFGDLEIDFED